jgi:hypothetical protein
LVAKLRFAAKISQLVSLAKQKPTNAENGGWMKIIGDGLAGPKVDLDFMFDLIKMKKTKCFVNRIISNGLGNVKRWYASPKFLHQELVPIALRSSAFLFSTSIG